MVKKHFLNIPLRDLRSGAEIGVDSRATGRDDGLEAFALDIRTNGLLQAPAVWIGGEDGQPPVPYVVFGNRRRAALLLNADAGFGPENPEIHCEVLTCGRDELLALSAIENLSRLPLHPIDQFEAFAGMAAAGMSRETIAHRFGLEEREVKQRLALGELAPEVRAAWRDRKLQEDEARAFTICPDHKRQAEYLSMLALDASWSFNARSIRTGLVGNESEGLARELTFVGRGDYLAAGGELQEDLFGTLDVVLSPGLLAQLVSAKGARLVADHMGDGWSWVAFEGDLPVDWRYSGTAFRRERAQAVFSAEDRARLEELESLEEYGGEEGKPEPDWEAIEAEKEAIVDRSTGYTDEQKARTGLVITLGRDGPEFLGGWVRIDDKLAREDAERRQAEGQRPADERPALPKGEPAAVVGLARQAQTAGLAAALAADPTAAKIALVATLELAVTRYARRGSPLCILVNGAGYGPINSEEDRPGDFEEAVAHARTLSPASLDRRLAQLVGASIDARTEARDGESYHSEGVTESGVAAVSHLLAVDKLTAETRRAFDADAYFTGARKEAALGAILDLTNAAEVAKWEKRKKGEIAAEATRLVEGVDWLPPSIRPLGWLPIKLVRPSEPVESSVAAAPASPSPKLTKADKAAIRALGEAKATAIEKGLHPALDKEGDPALNTATCGRLVNLGLVERGERGKGKAKRIVYWLTDAGANRWIDGV